MKKLHTPPAMVSNKSVFVKVFPAWERLAKGPSNGLVHAANQITTPDPAALGSTLTTELAAVNYAASSYNRVTFPIMVLATGRGVTFKELAAVSQGGAPYDAQKTELANGEKTCRSKTCCIGEKLAEANTEGTRKGRRREHTHASQGKYVPTCTYNN